MDCQGKGEEQNSRQGSKDQGQLRVFMTFDNRWGRFKSVDPHFVPDWFESPTVIFEIPENKSAFPMGK